MKYLSIVIIILIPLAIIVTNLSFLALNYNFYLKIYRQQDIYSNFYNANTLKNETGNLLGYFRGKNMLDYNFYSNQAVLHLKDVKKLLSATQVAALCSIISLTALTAYLILKKQGKTAFKSYLTGSIITLALTIISLIFIVLDFSNIFFGFHLMFFTNNYWLFEENDNLIKMFPQRFFISFANYLAANIIVTALLILLIVFSVKKIHAKPDD